MEFMPSYSMLKALASISKNKIKYNKKLMYLHLQSMDNKNPATFDFCDLTI
jgi:hypothetical protein